MVIKQKAMFLNGNVHFGFDAVPPSYILINNQSTDNQSRTERVFAGESYSLSCTVPSARPPPDISWNIPSGRAVYSVLDQEDKVQGDVYHSSRTVTITPTKGEDFDVHCDVSHPERIVLMRASVRMNVHGMIQRNARFMMA